MSVLLSLAVPARLRWTEPSESALSDGFAGDTAKVAKVASSARKLVSSNGIDGRTRRASRADERKLSWRSSICEYVLNREESGFFPPLFAFKMQASQEERANLRRGLTNEQSSTEEDE